MFDISEYYKNNNENTFKQIEDIDDAIFLEVEKIFKKATTSLYNNDQYKYKKHVVEIMSPSLEYTRGLKYIRGTDHIRFLLSLYPQKEDLKRIKKIIFRPRYVASDSVELVALFVRKTRTLVQYLNYPHDYMVDPVNFNELDEFIPYNISRMADNNYLGLGKIEDGAEIKMPPLLYVISKITENSRNEIDKFFLKIKIGKKNETVSMLDEISAYYAQHGY